MNAYREFRSGGRTSFPAPCDESPNKIAWQLCNRLRRLVLTNIRTGPAAKDFDYRSQLRRAARSACYNTSEGFHRYRHGQFGNQLNIAAHHSARRWTRSTKGWEVASEPSSATPPCNVPGTAREATGVSNRRPRSRTRKTPRSTPKHPDAPRCTRSTPDTLTPSPRAAPPCRPTLSTTRRTSSRADNRATGARCTNARRGIRPGST